jgi:hypothetical protein
MRLKNFDRQIGYLFLAEVPKIFEVVKREAIFESDT